MAFDEYQADRIRNSFKSKGIQIVEKKMMGGWCAMVDDKMCIGLLQKKTDHQDLLMVRIGEEKYESVKNEKHVLPMDFTGRPMRGYAFIAADGFDLEEDLNRWIEYCIEYNPKAKSSKRKKSKT